MATTAEIASPCGSAVKKKQMLLSDPLSLHIANILHADLQDPESRFSKVLEPPRTRGKPDAMKALMEFLMESEHPSCKEKTTTVATVTDWIDKLMTMTATARQGSTLNPSLLRNVTRRRTIHRAKN